MVEPCVVIDKTCVHPSVFLISSGAALQVFGLFRPLLVVLQMKEEVILQLRVKRSL